MGSVWDFNLQGVTGIPVFVSGQYTKLQKQHEWEPIVAWKGYARADEPLVAMTIHVDSSRLYWVKSVKYDLVGGDIREMAILPVILSFYDGKNTLEFSVGKKGIESHVKNSEEAMVRIRSLSTELITQTGRLVEFVRIPAEPQVSFGVLFLVRRDVKYARKCIWNIRKELLARIPLQKIFSSSRAGSILLSELDSRHTILNSP